MKLHAKVTLFFIGIAVGLLAVLVAISLYAFRSFSIATATEHIRTAGEIVRVHLTESMINGVIDKRERFLQRLVEVQSLKSARVIRSPEVSKQFGKGLSSEAAADDIEKIVLQDGKSRFEITDVDNETVFRGTIPYIATSLGNPNCLQCHQVPEGTVLGAVSMTMSLTALKEKALFTVAGIAAAVTFFALGLILLLRRQLKPISDTAWAVEEAVQRALRGDFKAHVEKKTNDEIGQIATDMNRLLTFLDEGLTRIGSNVARLINRTPTPGENLLTATIDMVDGLTKAAHFKQAIEEDESKEEIYERLSTTLKSEFGLGEYSIYEVHPNKRQMQSMMVDGQTGETCRWCDPQVLVRPEACRVARTGHVVDGVSTPDICYSFQPPADVGERRHVCFPVMQSGSVGSVVQLLTTPERAACLSNKIPFVNVYLRETAPVLETKRLMESLRDSTLRDPMTGLHKPPLPRGVRRNPGRQRPAQAGARDDHDARPRLLQDGQRHLRPRCRRRRSQGAVGHPAPGGTRLRSGHPLRRRGIHDHSARHARRSRREGRRRHPRRGREHEGASHRRRPAKDHLDRPL